ncbi:uncharacterized protein METZ01_LOCUS441903 [marine metagenome]|uniref:Uncharacterized protein n=1 Tax=marine metagenome TaxID=408172 RepID=A0A382Z1G9_9ZZZZ
MALVTKADVKTYMDITLSPLQEDSADLILAGLQSEMETYLGRPVEVNTYTDEVHVLGSDHVGVPMSSFFYSHDYSDSASGAWPTISTFTDPPETVYLRNSPIVTVTSVTRRSASASATTDALVEYTNYLVRRYGIDVYGSLPNDKITVTYTAGLAGGSIPMLKLLLLRAAAREMQNMHDDVVGIKDLEPRETALAEIGFLEKELMSIKRYRRVRAA